MNAPAAPSSWISGANRAFWIGTALLAALAGLSRFQPVVDPDTPWHLTTAVDVLKAGSWSYVDTTSFTADGKIYTNYPWLGDLILLGFWRAGSWAGLTVYSVLTAVLSTIACALVALRASRGRVWLALIATSLVAGAVNFTLEPRPQALYMLFTPLGLLLAEDFAVASERRALIRATVGLVVLQLVWTHVHSSSILLPPIAGFALLETRGFMGAVRRSWLAVLLGLVLITGPGGIAYFLWVHEVAIGDATKHIAEMKPMELSQLYPMHFNSVLWLDLLLGLGAVRAIRSGKVRWVDLMRSAFGIALAFTSRRFRAPWAILSVPFASRSHDAVSPEGRVVRMVAILSIALVLPLNIQNGITRDPARGFGLGMGRDAFAIDAVKLIERADLRGKLLNWYDDGGFIELMIGDRVKIAIDGRTPTLFDSELYFWWRAAMSDQPGYAEFMAKFQPDMALVFRSFPICRRLASSPGEWRPVFTDDTRAFFVKTGFADRLPSFSRVYACDPERGVAQICAGGEEAVAAAREELDRSIALAGGEAPYLQNVRAKLELDCGGDAERAKASASAILSSGTRIAPFFATVAEVLRRSGDREGADAMLDQAIALGAGTPAKLTKAKMMRSDGNTLGAIEELEAILEEHMDLAPVEARVELAKAYLELGDRERAKLHAQRAVRVGGSEEAKQLLEQLGP